MAAAIFSTSAVNVLAPRAQEVDWKLSSIEMLTSSDSWWIMITRMCQSSAVLMLLLASRDLSTQSKPCIQSGIACLPLHWPLTAGSWIFRSVLPGELGLPPPFCWWVDAIRVTRTMDCKAGAHSGRGRFSRNSPYTMGTRLFVAYVHPFLGNPWHCMQCMGAWCWLPPLLGWD